MTDNKAADPVIEEYPPEEEEDKMEEEEEESKKVTRKQPPAKKTAPAADDKQKKKKQTDKELSKKVATNGTIARPAGKKEKTESDEKKHADHLPIVAANKAIKMTDTKGSSGAAGDVLREYIAGYIETAVSMALNAVPEDKKTLKAVHLETVLALNE